MNWIGNRYRLNLQYLGSNYCGWQIQQNGITVQQVLQEKLSQLCNSPVELVGCGRTDSGVHARRFTAHFDFDGEIPTDLAYRINKMLPNDISVFDCQAISPEFHARFSAIRRSYEYYIHLEKNAFLSQTSWWNPQLASADIDLANQAASWMIGTHPFSAFCKGEIPNNNPLCEVFEANWSQTECGWVFRITANRFLRNMVRATVGTLLDVAQKRSSMEEFRSLLMGGNRSDAGNSVPACGLFLTEVHYPSHF